MKLKYATSASGIFGSSANEEGGCGGLKADLIYNSNGQKVYNRGERDPLYISRGLK